MPRTTPRLALALTLLAAAPAPADDRVERAAEKIDAEEMLGHIRTLASDEFEGRAPASEGEERTVAYLVEQFKRMGLAPGNPDGTYVQDVPLVGFTSKVEGHIRVGDEAMDLEGPETWVAVSRRQVPEAEVRNSEIVFVGYGVVAPEFGWDDYKGLDVRGKTILMLVNDPPVPDPDDPSKLDPDYFAGKGMTYYGRWTYKYEIAAEKGAAAAIIVHETGPAGYPFEVVSGSWGRENFDIPAEDKNASRAAVEAWITRDIAGWLFAACGCDFEEMKRAAASKDFRPVPLGAQVSFTARNTLREVESRNVIARLEGSDPELKDEHIVYTAHWDHLGKDESLDGDQIFNGAADNASGTAMLLEIAEAFAAMEPAPKRSVLFLAVTAEEKGLLGAKSYAEHPLYPLETTLADINADVINLWGRTKDVTSVGLGQTTLDDLLAEVAGASGRVVRGDPEPEKGLYYRSDHFEFARAGVPALNAKGGVDYVDKPEGYGIRKRDEYTKDDYHKVSDEVKPDWDLAGAVDDARLLFEVGVRVADGDSYPEWKEGSEFKARREAMLKDKGEAKAKSGAGR